MNYILKPQQRIRRVEHLPTSTGLNSTLETISFSVADAILSD